MKENDELKRHQDADVNLVRFGFGEAEVEAFGEVALFFVSDGDVERILIFVKSLFGNNAAGRCPDQVQVRGIRGARRGLGF